MGCLGGRHPQPPRLDAGDADTAERATHQARLADPAHLSLFDWDMHVAHRRRDVDGLHRAYKARRRAQALADLLREVPRETVEVYERLLADLEGHRQVHRPRRGQARAIGREQLTN